MAFGRKRGEPRFYLSQADWSFWGKHGRLPLVDVILLSVDLAPETEPRSTPTGLEKLQLFKGLLEAENYRRLDRRARIVLASAEELRFADGGTGGLASPVRLLDFREFADIRELGLPAGFPKRTGPNAGYAGPGAASYAVRPVDEPRKVKPADWGYWKPYGTCPLWQAILLTLDVEPRAFMFLPVSGVLRSLLGFEELSVSDHSAIRDRAGISASNIRALSPEFEPQVDGNALTAPVALRVFGEWATSVWANLPRDFPGTASAISHHVGRRWPWGDYETELLAHLAAAVEHFWKTYDPESAPTNENVADWLVARSVAKKNADAIARVIRPKDVPAGPRKKAWRDRNG